MTKPFFRIKTVQKPILCTGSAIWALLVLIFSSLPQEYHQKAGRFVAEASVALIKLVFVSFSVERMREFLLKIAPVGIMVVCYAVFAWILYFTIRAFGKTYKRSAFLSAALLFILTAVDELHQIIVPGAVPQFARFFFNISGGITALGILLLSIWMLRRFPSLFNRETISYVFFGVLTTLVNLIAYGQFYNSLGIPNLVSNALAWVLAVLFAYVVNKLFVFQSHTESPKQMLKEFWRFIAARLLSLGVDELMMWLMVDVARINDGISKISANVVVLIMNYFFSKRIIFSNRSKSNSEQNTAS